MTITSVAASATWLQEVRLVLLRGAFVALAISKVTMGALILTIAAPTTRKFAHRLGSTNLRQLGILQAARLNQVVAIPKSQEPRGSCQSMGCGSDALGCTMANCANLCRLSWL